MNNASLVSLLLIIAACERSTDPPDPPDPPRGPDTPVAIAADGRVAPENVLSARVSFLAPGADSVRISYWPTGGAIQVTPFRPGRAGTHTIIVLGLRAATTYQYQVEALGDGIPRKSVAGAFQTTALPEALANVEFLQMSGSTSELAVTTINTASGRYAVAFDNAGVVIWYHDFASYGKPVSNVLKQSNGSFTAYVGSTSGWQVDDGYYVEITPEGQEVAQYRAPAGHYVDNHEMVITGAGATKRAHFFTYSIRTLDLTAIGGRSSVQTAGHQIMRMNASGTPEFIWDAWDNISVDEWISDDDLKASRTTTDFDHPNALAFDADGNYVVSWRHLDQIMAVDAHTGSVLWRVGGAKGDHRLVDDPFGKFSKQHSVKMLSNGNMLLFDNGKDHAPSESRAVEYKLDHAAKTATMVWQYRHNPAISTAVLGWTERLTSGNTWVAFSARGRVVEVDANSELIWEGQLRVNQADAAAYRIVRIKSLN